MQTSDSPKLLPIPFASSGTKNDIPTNPSDIPGRASLTAGFPPETMLPLVAGGKPPTGNDFNGILYLLSAASRWGQAGGTYLFNADFVIAVGGYPRGAVLSSTSPGTLWLSVVDNNSTNPDSVGSAGWLRILVGDVGVPTGAVEMFAMNAPPVGWLKANGGAVSRAAYPALFSAIGTTWGAGDGTSTFNLPDLRGEFLRGWDDGRGIDPGRAFASAQADLFKAHRHQMTSSITRGASTLGDQGERVPFLSNDYDTGTIMEGGVETRPRNVALLFCVKY